MNTCARCEAVAMLPNSKRTAAISEIQKQCQDTFRLTAENLLSVRMAHQVKNLINQYLESRVNV